MVPPTTEPCQRPPQSRRIWSVALSLLALFLVAPFVFFALYDAPAPDDTLLTPQLPLERNAEHEPPQLTDFLLAAMELQWTSVPPLNFDNSTVGPDEAQVLLTHEDLLDKFDALLAINPDSWTWPTSQPHPGVPKSVPSKGALRAVTNLQLLRARSEFQAEKTESAIRRCLHLTRFAHKLRGMTPSYYELLFSMENQVHAEETLQRMITHPAGSDALIQECLDTLRPLTSPSREELILGIQIHYQDFKALINDPAAQRQLMQDITGRTPERQLRVKVNQSLTLWLQDTAPVVEALSRGWTEGLSAAAQLPVRNPEISWWETVHAFLTWNNDGRYFHLGHSIKPGETPLNVMEHDRRHQVTMLMLALRLHAIRHGTLPNHLEELTPEILPEQPVDLFSGRPFHWDPIAQRISGQGAATPVEHSYWWRTKR